MTKDANNNVLINWDPPGYKLQTASPLWGDWTDVQTTNSSYRVNFGLLPFQFFRVIRNCP